MWLPPEAGRGPPDPGRSGAPLTKINQGLIMTAKKKSRFFKVDHGIDNREEWIDLDRVYFVVCNAIYDSGKKYITGIKKLQDSLKRGDAYFDYHMTFLCTSDFPIS